MKFSHLFLLIFFSVSCYYGKSQSFRIYELEVLCTKNVSDLEDILLQKKYEFDSYDTVLKRTIYVQGKLLSTRGAGTRMLYFQKAKKNTNFISYFTINKNEYLLLKSDIKARGYKFLSSDTKEGGIMYAYQSPTFTLTLSTQVAMSIEGRMSNTYSVQILKTAENID